MAEGCCGSLMKWGLAGINFIFGLLAVAMLGIGGYVYHVVGDYSTVSGESFIVVPIFLLCLGGFTFMLAIFGWCGSVKENKCLTMTYAVIMIILVVLEISAGITAFVKKDDVSRALVNIAQDSMNNYKQEIVRETWDTIQDKFDCCGVETYQDWSNQTITNGSFITYAKQHGWKKDGPPPKNTEFPVPDSCCVENKESCGLSYDLLKVKDELRPKGSNKGCAAGLEDWIGDNLGLIAGIAVGIAVIEIIGIVCAIYLVRSEGGYDYQYNTFA